MKRPIFILAIIAFFCTCKKVTKEVNSEKYFHLIFVDSLQAPANMCFDRVWVDGKANVGNCSDFKNGLNLPLSINADSCKYFIQQSGKIDTLVVKYDKSIQPGDAEFEVIFRVTKIRSSFKKITNECILEINPICDGNKAHLSAIVYQ